MTGWLDFYYAAKAWWSAVVVAVGQVLTLIQVMLADNAISLSEAQGVGVAITQAATVVAGFVAVFKTRNKSNYPPGDPNITTPT